jgi:hypothetical protein
MGSGSGENIIFQISCSLESIKQYRHPRNARNAIMSALYLLFANELRVLGKKELKVP